MSKDDVFTAAFSKRVRRQVNGRVRDYFAVCAPGLEPICRRELSGVGQTPQRRDKEIGGVSFSGRFVDCMRANLYSRTSTRVLMRITSFSATNFRQLEKKIAAVSWELFLPCGALPAVRVRSIQSRLYHSRAITETVHKGIVRRLGEPKTQGEQPPLSTLFIRVVTDRIVLSVDSSGEPLYKRGLKAGSARAPLRETLAAAILYAAGFDPKRPLVDPFCGSGTFSLEASLMAKQMAPGLFRRFAFMDWPAFRPKQWAHLQRMAQAQKIELPAPLIFASDIVAEDCARLREIADDHRLRDALRVERKDFFDCRGASFGDRAGLVVINPPYGRRLGSIQKADDLFASICQHLAFGFRGWSVALIVPRPALTRCLPFPARRMPLRHGGLNLTLIIGKIP